MTEKPLARGSAVERQLILAALTNAHELIVDAQILRANQRWARSHALAELAMEEVGKAWLAHSYLYFHADAGQHRPNRNHFEKLTAARQMIGLVRPYWESGVLDIEAWFSEEHEYEAEADYEARMGGLYVDIVDGLVVGGTDSVTKQQAERTVALADEVVHRGMSAMWVLYDDDGAEESGGP